MLTVGDAMALSPQTDGTLFIAQLGKVRLPMIKEAGRLLAASPARCVLTGAQREEGYGDCAYAAYERYADAETPRTTAAVG